MILLVYDFSNSFSQCSEFGTVPYVFTTNWHLVRNFEVLVGNSVIDFFLPQILFLALVLSQVFSKIMSPW